MLTTGLMAGPRGRSVARRGRRVLTVGVTAGTLVGAVLLSSVGAAVLQKEAAPPTELIDRLTALERELPSLPPDDVLIDDDETSADFTGDFTGAELALNRLEGDARDLFIAADESEGEVAAAVSDAARSLLLLQEAYARLAAWESNDLTFPVDDEDDLDVATDADQLHGLLEAGMELLLRAHELRLPAFEVLRDAAEADSSQQAFFSDRYDVETAFDAQLRPKIHEGISLGTTQVLQGVDRFETTSPGVEARARTMRVVCLDRRGYYADGEATASPAPEPLAALDPATSADCPDVVTENEVRVVEP